MSLGFIAYIIMMLIDKKENDKIYEKISMKIATM